MATNEVRKIESRAEFQKLVDETPYVAIQATAGWCGPCKAISPLFVKHAKELGSEKYIFAKFDIDDVPDLSQELGISSIPAFFFFENGNKDSDFKGAAPPVLKKNVELYSDKAKGELKTNEDF